MKVKHYKVYQILFLLAGVMIATESVNSQQDLIRLNTTSGNSVRPGENVTITCTAIGSSIIAWSSDEYIGRGGVRLELFAFTTSRESSQISTATAVLLNTSYNSEGDIVLTSALSLIAKIVPYISVTCINIGRETNSNTTLNVSVHPQLNTPNNDSNIYPGDTVAFTCETRATDSLTWKVKYFGNQLLPITITSSDTSTPRAQSSDNVTIQAALAGSSTKNGYTVLESVVNVTIQSTGYYGGVLLVFCQNDELMTTSNITLLVTGPDDCEVTSTPDHIILSDNSRTTSSQAAQVHPSIMFIVVAIFLYNIIVNLSMLPTVTS